MNFKLKGSDLNFRVYPATAFPDSGIENDICFISDVAMSDWYLSPKTPVGTPKNEGDVWIQYSVTGYTFNALKNNTMAVAPFKVYQYIGGAWTEKEAKNYRDGEWIDWITWLFKEGTGAVLPLVNDAGYMTVTNDGITCLGTKSDGLYTAQALTFGRPFTLYVEATISVVGTSADYVGSLVAKTPDAYGNSRNDHPSTATVRALLSADNVRMVYRMTLDPGTYHVGVSGNIKGTIHNMWIM